ncbi:MAG: hypothetical protein GY928_11020 [Colwellia sp.]|nr:hypothetical protein [Colwellia sp.]
MLIIEYKEILAIAYKREPYNNKIVAELAGWFFIGIDWACEGYKATNVLCQPCQSAKFWALAG